MAAVVDWDLRLRMLCSLVVVVLVNAVFFASLLAGITVLVVVAVVFGVAVGIGASSTIVGWTVVAAGVLTICCAIGGVGLQIRHGARTVLDGLDADPIDGDGPRNVGGRVRRLAANADVPVPSVAVVEESEPTSLTVRDGGTATIVVTEGLLDGLDDDELDAVLAHEIAHVANRDVFLATAVASMVTVADRLFERERAYRRLLRLIGVVSMFAYIMLVFALPLVALSVVYVAASVVARVILAANAIVFGLFVRSREYSADRGACKLTGDPAALASALETIGGGTPETDARMRAASTLGVVPRPLDLGKDAADDDHWLESWLESIGFRDGESPIEFSDEEGTDPHPITQRIGGWLRTRVVDPVVAAIRRALAWRPATHPPTEKRIERLGRRERS